MYCGKCGNFVNETSSFCPACGNMVSAEGTGRLKSTFRHRGTAEGGVYSPHFKGVNPSPISPERRTIPLETPINTERPKHPAPGPSPSVNHDGVFPGEYIPPAEAVPVHTAVPTPPARPLKTNKGLFKYIIFSILTFGIYPIVVMSSVSNSINTVATRYDGRRTMHFCLLFFLVAPITFGIANFVWYSKISNRIGRELQRRNIAYSFGAGTYWGWNILGSLIVVGPFIYLYKLFKSTNLICENYNICG